MPTTKRKSLIRPLEERDNARSELLAEINEPEEDGGIVQRFIDRTVAFLGSGKFILLFLAAIVFWMSLNLGFILSRAFDPYPFILLNLALSCLSAIQAPLIMMAQNRQEERDRARSKKTLAVALKTELETRDVLQKVKLMVEKVDKLIPSE